MHDTDDDIEYDSFTSLSGEEKQYKPLEISFAGQVISLSPDRDLYFNNTAADVLEAACDSLSPSYNSHAELKLPIPFFRSVISTLIEHGNVATEAKDDSEYIMKGEQV
jgi:hypothetical protein